MSSIRIWTGTNKGGIYIARDIIIDEDKKTKEHQYDLWKEFMKSNGEDPEFWYQNHLEKDHPIKLCDQSDWFKDAGFKRTGCYWRFYNFAITYAEK